MCNQCFRTKNGDGFAAISWNLGHSFLGAVKLVAEYLGVATTAAKRERQPDDSLILRELLPAIAGLWCLKKPPIKMEALAAFGGKQATYTFGRKGKPPLKFSLVAVPAFAPGKPEPTACVIWNTTRENPIDPTIGMLPKFVDDGQPLAWATMKSTAGSRSGLIGTLADVPTAELVWKTGGPVDALALHSIMPAEYRGRHAVITNAGGEDVNVQPAWIECLQGRPRVAIVHDCDRSGEHGQGKWETALAGKVADVRVVKLPYPIAESHGKDLRDWINEGHSYADLLALLESTAPSTAEALREIIVDVDEHRVADQSVAALAEAAAAGKLPLFQRGGRPVQPIFGADPPAGIDRPKEAAAIGIVRAPTIREMLTKVATFRQASEDGDGKAIHPPAWLPHAIENRGHYKGIPPLTAIVETPILRADGSILSAPGYDHATGILFRPNAEYPPVPDRPIQRDAARALGELLEVVADFPFAGNHHASAWLASVLTVLSRFAFHGPAPFFLIDANIRGSGKSLLADTISWLTMGRAAARMTVCREEDEFRKRVTALALAGERLVLIDNITGQFGGPTLDAATTATSWSDRVLGSSTMATNIPLFATWIGTANNAMVLGDTLRRVCCMRLESSEERPEEREGFRHTDLLGWLRRERPRLVTAALTILRAHAIAGRPATGGKPWGSYEAWSAVVREAVTWIGQPDPAGTRAELASTVNVPTAERGWVAESIEGKGIAK